MVTNFNSYHFQTWSWINVNFAFIERDFTAENHISIVILSMLLPSSCSFELFSWLSSARSSLVDPHCSFSKFQSVCNWHEILYVPIPCAILSRLRFCMCQYAMRNTLSIKHASMLIQINRHQEHVILLCKDLWDSSQLAEAICMSLISEWKPLPQLANSQQCRFDNIIVTIWIHVKHQKNMFCRQWWITREVQKAMGLGWQSWSKVQVTDLTLILQSKLQAQVASNLHKALYLTVN